MNPRTLSQLLQDLEAQLTTEKVSVSQLMETFHERGFGFFLFFLALPAALPLPGLGINMIIAFPMLLLTFQQIMGRQTIWLPEKIKRRNISSNVLKKMIKVAMPWMIRLEALIKPRLEFMTHGLASKIIGLLGFLMALSVLFPVPLTNTVPSFGIVLMAIGILMRDGLSVLVGAIIGTAWVIMLVSVILIFGPEGVDLIKETIKSFLPG
ncbi:MAG: exopolysaccharide biosynthesis protein [Nitrospirae bacterium]|nr:exopolysaccharide biosynthesis protein [Candidatus Manganitrophaceae bacterium]